MSLREATDNDAFFETDLLGRRLGITRQAIAKQFLVGMRPAPQ